MGTEVGEICLFHAETEEKLSDHESRIRCLEKSNTEMLVRLDNLCKQIAELTSTIKRALYGAGGIGVAFIIWYIQSLPR